MIRSIRRAFAERAVDRVDADIARYFVDDGTLAEPCSTDTQAALRGQRIRAVERLVRSGGRDPHPTFTRPLTAAQEAAQHRRGDAATIALLDELADVLRDVVAYPRHSNPGRPAVSFEHRSVALYERALAALRRAAEHANGDVQ